jgi:hypothetical protein
MGSRAIQEERIFLGIEFYLQIIYRRLMFDTQALPPSSSRRLLLSSITMGTIQTFDLLFPVGSWQVQ